MIVNLDKNTLLDAYRRMKTIREFEMRLRLENEAGQLPGFIHLSCGQEAIAVGVSLDSMESHRRFKEEHALPFPLVADTDRRVIRLYDVEWGRWTSRAQRVTYLIDKAGLIRDVFRHELAIGRHQEDVLEGLKRINEA